MKRISLIYGGFFLFLILALPLFSFGQEPRRSSESDLESKPTEAKSQRAEGGVGIIPPCAAVEFVSATGTRAALFGNEAGRLEAWVYRLKILRDFHLRFHLRSLDIPSESLARTITVRPESTSILYAGDTFAVRETLFVPVHEQGAIIKFEIDAGRAGRDRSCVSTRLPIGMARRDLGHLFVLGPDPARFRFL